MQEMDYCGLVSGREVDKSGLFQPFYDTEGTAPLIAECPLNFLCKVCDSKEIRGFTMFFGDIVAVYVNEDCVSQGQPDPIKIDPVIMMAFSYLKVERVIGLPFTEGKKLSGFGG
jgi:flavin reductase (DIM6/NTAB) family NADH-FMN oxidoreductase RutF